MKTTKAYFKRLREKLEALSLPDKIIALKVYREGLDSALSGKKKDDSKFFSMYKSFYNFSYTNITMLSSRSAPQAFEEIKKELEIIERDIYMPKYYGFPGM